MNILKVLDRLKKVKHSETRPVDLVCRSCNETFEKAQLVGDLLPVHFDSCEEECGGSGTTPIRVSLKNVAPVGME
jgi:hypothetical protein